MPSPIPPPGTHFISLAQFEEMKDTYAKSGQSILQPQYQFKQILVTSETFNGDLLTAIQQVNGFAGFRIYYGMSTDLKVHAMLVAVDQNGDDLLPAATNAKFGATTFMAGGGVAGEEGQRCPPACG